MRRTGRLATIGYAGAFALAFVVAAAAWATPHLPYTITGAITNADASVPSASAITFTAFVQARPAETITQATQGVSIAPFNSQLWYTFDCSYFATQWASGDVLVVNMQNTSNGQSASATWTLDNNGAKTLNIQLQSPPSLVVTSPHTGDAVEAGTLQSIIWISAGSPSPAYVKIEVSFDNGAHWIIIAASVPNNPGTNTYTWAAPSVAAAQCLIRVTSTTGDTTGRSGVFPIVISGLALTWPHGGEVLDQSTSHNITWMSVGSPGATVKLEFSSNNGTSWTTIVASTENDGAFSWIVPDIATKQARVRVSSGAFSSTSPVFTIIGHATKLAFVVHPSSNVPAMSVIAPSPSVEVLDSVNSHVASSTAGVTLALMGGGGSDPRLLGGNAAQLLGTNPISAVAGLAIFSDLRITLAGTGYILHATSPGLTPADSPPFDVTADPAPTVTSSHPNPDTAVNAGDSVVYTVTYGNAGLADALHTVIVETLPADLVFVSATGSGVYDTLARTITWQAGTVTAGVTGSTVTFAASVATSGAILNGGTITNSQLTIVCDGIATPVATSPVDVMKVKDQNPPAVSGRVPAADSVTAGRLTPIKLHITDAGSGVDLTSVHITASRDGGATKDDLCVGLAADATSYNAEGNTVFKGAMHIVGTTPADYTFIFLADAAFDFEETVTIGVTASDKSGNPLVPTPATYEFTTETRSFGYNTRVDGGTKGNAFAATATDPDGNIWVAWERSDAAGKGVIYLAERKAGGNMFQTEIPVTKTGDCHMPAIAIAADKTIYVAYEKHGANPSVMVATATTTVAADTTWGTLGAVTDSVTSETVTGSPAITVDSTGKLYVAGTGLFGGAVQQIGLGTLANPAAQWIVIPSSGEAAKRTPAIAKDAGDHVYVVWEQGANLYGADCSNWVVVHPITNSGKAISPAIATESAAATVLHFAWTDTDGLIRYASTAADWSGVPVTGVNVLDQEVHDAGAPKVAVTGVGPTAKAFVVWEDRRYSTLSEATEIMFAETKTDGTFGTNIYVSYVLGTSDLASPGAADRAETIPALGLANNGEPYVAWPDQALPNGDSHIYFSKAMCGGSVNAQNLHITSVDITVPPDACDVALNLVANELLNPPTECPAGNSLFTDGSGAYLEITGGLDEVLNDWVTITMHLAAGVTLRSRLVVYRLEPLTGGGWAWTDDYIRGEIATFDAATQTWSVTFQTKHLSSFGLSSTEPPVWDNGRSSGGGGGGCSMSPNGEPDVFVLLLPLAALGFWLATRLIGRGCSAKV